MSDVTKIPRCPTPSAPGMFLTRVRPGGLLSLVVVTRSEADGCLYYQNGFHSGIPVSRLDPNAKFWGPIEVTR